MQVRARACITRRPTSHSNSIVKNSFSITKKESSNEDCIVMFLTEKFVQMINKVMIVKEEKGGANTKKKQDLNEFFSQKHRYTIIIWALLLSHRKRIFYNRI